MARLSDLGCELSVVGPLVLLGILGAQGNHAPGETGQVPHLVVQVPPAPLGNVGQPPGGHIHQVGLDCLGARWELGRERGVGGHREGAERAESEYFGDSSKCSSTEPSVPGKGGPLTSAGRWPTGAPGSSAARPAKAWGLLGAQT